MDKEQKPSVGRVVHYVSTLGAHNHLAATVAYVHPDGSTVNIGYLDESGHAHSRTKAAYDESAKPGTWHWPERV